MKKIKDIYRKVAVLWVLVFILSACDTDKLAELNKNPNAVNDMDMSFLLAQAQLHNYPNIYAVSSLESTVSAYIQQMAAIGGYWNIGDKYLEATLAQADFLKLSYTGPVVIINEVIEKSRDDADAAALFAVARITRVIIMHRLTDLYGDIPYFDGGKSFIDANFLPVYDPQEEIYADMLKELEESAEILSGSVTFDKPNQDLIYGGDLTKWKKLANSLMLRLGMRMSKVNPASAEAWVNKAVTAGVLSSNDDNAIMYHSEGPTMENRNPRYWIYEVDDNMKLSKVLVDWLKDNNDPRMMVLSGGIGELNGPKDMDPTHQNGLPSGYDVVTIKEYESTTEDVDVHNTYSRSNLLLTNRVAPSMILVYGEVQLLLAEAAQKGWIAGDPATFYKNGVVAGMTMYGVFDGLPTYVSESEANDYLTANPYVPANGLEMIAMQYWVINYTNVSEAFSNWRRTGIPELTPVVYPTSRTNGEIPRRLKYLPSEAVTNGDNFNAAIKRQGPDTYTTRIWWDAE